MVGVCNICVCAMMIGLVLNCDDVSYYFVLLIGMSGRREMTKKMMMMLVLYLLC